MIKKEINVDEYKFLSGKTIDEILKTQTSWKNDRECLLSIINNDISSVSDFADKKDIQALNKIKASSENPETDLRTLAVYSDVATRYMCVKHFDQHSMNENRRPYLTKIVNVTAQDEFPWELPDFIKDDLEEYPDFSISNVSTEENIKDKQIEKLTEQVNSLQSAFTNSTTITVPQFDSNGNPVMKSNGVIATAKLNCPKGINVALGKLARENMILRSENQQLRNQLNNQNINNDMSGFDM